MTDDTELTEVVDAETGVAEEAAPADARRGRGSRRRRRSGTSISPTCSGSRPTSTTTASESLRDQEQLVARAHEGLVKELLPVLDDLERALGAAEVHDEATVVEGVRLVQRALADQLAREGLAEIEADGAFDPHIHEALLAQPGEGAEPGTVLQVVQKGYRLGDRVLRPARVVIAE